MPSSGGEKPLYWVGRSERDAEAFPLEVREDLYFELRQVRKGREPSNWKPFPTVGPGVRELRFKDASGAYRVLYVADIGGAVYVLHAFQKKDQKTPTKEVKLAQRRLKEAKR